MQGDKFLSLIFYKDDLLMSSHRSLNQPTLHKAWDFIAFKFLKAAGWIFKQSGPLTLLLSLPVQKQQRSQVSSFIQSSSPTLSAILLSPLSCNTCDILQMYFPEPFNYSCESWSTSSPNKALLITKHGTETRLRFIAVASQQKAQSKMFQAVSELA